MDFMKSNPVDPLNKAAFEESCGVGVVITREQIADKVNFLLTFKWRVFISGGSVIVM